MTAVHDHPHTQDSHPHVHGGPPVLDIGGDIGALLALMDEEWIGLEVFVGNLDNNAETHTGVWRRSLADGQTVAAAVFLELVEGMYEVLGDPGRDREPVPIRGGELTELDLRADFRQPVAGSPLSPLLGYSGLSRKCGGSADFPDLG